MWIQFTYINICIKLYLHTIYVNSVYVLMLSLCLENTICSLSGLCQCTANHRSQDGTNCVPCKLTYNTYTRLQTHTHTHTCTRAHTQTHKRTCTHTHTHKYANTQ